MKLRIRKEFRGRILYIVFADTEWVGGICSRLGMNSEKSIDNPTTLDSLHIPMFDYDDGNIEDIKKTMETFFSQTMYIMSDKEGHYRVIGTEPITWDAYISYMWEELRRGLDYQFFRWTIIRGYATLRITSKKSRNKENEIVEVINGTNKDKAFINEEYTFEFYQADKDGRKIEID